MLERLGGRVVFNSHPHCPLGDLGRFSASLSPGLLIREVVLSILALEHCCDGYRY